MAKYVIDEATLQGMADAIRAKTGKSESIPVTSMATEIGGITTGSTENKLAKLVDGSITEITAEELDGVTKIHDYAFSARRSMTSVTLPNSLKEISNRAFEMCSGLQNIRIPASVETISSSAFSSCTNLNVVFEEENSKLKTLGTNAFSYVYKTIEITIPSSVTLMLSAFYYCGGLERVIMKPTTPPSLQVSCFQNTSLKEIIVPQGCAEAYKAATNWSAYADIIVEAGLEAGLYETGTTNMILSWDEMDFEIGSDGVINERPGGISGDLVIADGITGFRMGLFSGSTGLTGIVMPKSVTFVCAGSFNNTGIINLEIGEGVTRLEDSCFGDCDSLVSVVIPESVTYMECPFDYCDNLVKIVVKATTPPQLSGSFYGCSSLTEIIVPVGCGAAYKSATNWSEYADIIKEEAL